MATKQGKVYALDFLQQITDVHFNANLLFLNVLGSQAVGDSAQSLPLTFDVSFPNNEAQGTLAFEPFAGGGNNQMQPTPYMLKNGDASKVQRFIADTPHFGGAGGNALLVWPLVAGLGQKFILNMSASILCTTFGPGVITSQIEFSNILIIKPKNWKTGFTIGTGGGGYNIPDQPPLAITSGLALAPPTDPSTGLATPGSYQGNMRILVDPVKNTLTPA